MLNPKIKSNLHVLGVQGVRGSSYYSYRYIKRLAACINDEPRTNRQQIVEYMAGVFARTNIAHQLITSVTNDYESHLVQRLKELPTGTPVITIAGIMSLLGTPQSTISGWVNRGLLTPLTRSGEPDLQNGIFFSEEQFRTVCSWSLPLDYQGSAPPIKPDSL